MQILNIKKIKGVKYIITLKNGSWLGFSRQADAEKHKKELLSTGEFEALYFYADDGFFYTGHYYKE